MIREQKYEAMPGLPMLLLFLVAAALEICGLRQRVPARARDGWRWASAVALLLTLFLSAGLFVVNPNEGRVLQLFGDYVGTARTPGLRWANPFFTKKRISLRVRNFESARLKVNDNEGNPDRDRGGRRLAGGRHRRGGLPGRRLQQLRQGAERVGAAQPRDPLHLRHPRRRDRCRCAATPRKWPSI